MRKLSNSSLTQSSREFEKSALNRHQVLFRADFSAQPTNLTQDTRIAECVESNNNKSARSANPCKSFCYFWLSPKVESPLPLDPNLPNNANNAQISELKKDDTLFSNAIAITGGIATGKSTACNILRLHGYSIIDMDSIAHNVLEQSKDEVVGAFGTEILECDSSDSSVDSYNSNKDSHESKINRKKLGAIVFSDKAKLATLESILHPKIRAEVSTQAQKLEAQNILYFIDIPLFFELQAKGNGYEIPRTLLIYAPKELQLARMQKRDSLSENEAKTRLANQMDIETKRQMADFVIENTGNIRDLQSKIEAFLKQIN